MEIRSAFQLAAAALDPRNFVFIDEFGANLGMVPRYARSKAGERVHVNRPAKRGRNITFVGALTLEGLLTVDDLPGSTTIVNFLEWVQDVLVPLLRPGQIVIMDNLNAHKDAAVREAIEGVGARVLLLPPYSPDLNPIEECWSAIKTQLRRACARTEETLLLVTQIAADLVSSSDAHGWFRHSGYVPTEGNQHV